MKIHDINKAKQMLEQGQIIAIPTETVYGLAACIDNPLAIKNIFTCKERPFFDPLIVHIADIKQAKTLVKSWDHTTDKLAKAFWPGPLTLICEKNTQKINDMITSGLSTVGLRCPQHPLTLQLLQKLSSPLAAPSANKFTKTSPTTTSHVLNNFNHKIPVLDGGPCQVGLESTIVKVEENKKEVQILRPGMIGEEDIKKVIPSHYKIVTLEKKQVPGSSKTHYRPPSPLYIINKECNLKSIIKPTHQDFNKEELTLSKEAPLAARELYAKLHKLNNPHTVYYFKQEQIHQQSQWYAIMNRLKRAAINGSE